MLVEQGLGAVLIEVVCPLEHRGDVALQRLAQLGSASAPSSVAQSQQALSLRVESQQTQLGKSGFGQGPAGQIKTQHPRPIRPKRAECPLLQPNPLPSVANSCCGVPLLFCRTSSLEGGLV